MGYSVGVELSTWQRARTKSTIALPSKRVDPVKMRSTATTTLCDIVSPIDSLTLAAIERMNRMIANTWQINLKQSNEMELRSSELMLTLGRSERCKLVAPLDPKPGKFKFKFMAPRFRFKLLPWIENGKGRGKREKKKINTVCKDAQQTDRTADRQRRWKWFLFQQNRWNDFSPTTLTLVGEVGVPVINWGLTPVPINCASSSWLIHFKISSHEWPR